MIVVSAQTTSHIPDERNIIHLFWIAKHNHNSLKNKNNLNTCLE